MHLLVSVATPRDASAALSGGADVIDAKDPTRGALGAVTPSQLARIGRTVGGRRLLSAALGDAAEEDALAEMARTAAVTGAVLVKVGFAGVACARRAGILIEAAVRGAAGAGGRVVAVAYADAAAHGADGLPVEAIIEAAAQAGATGLLVDTADKAGPGLCRLVQPAALARLVANAHAAGLFAALAGRLTAADLPLVRDAGADIAGVRGAACDGGRTGLVVAARVAALRAQCGDLHGAVIATRPGRGG